VTDQPEDRAHRNPGQHQDTDRINPPVPDGANSHAQGREHPAQQQGCHGRHAGRTQHFVGHQRGGNVEDHDHRDRAELATLGGGRSGGSAGITSGVHANGPSVTLRKAVLALARAVACVSPCAAS
jgi:hypothetical protein